MLCFSIALLIAAQGSITDSLWTEETEHYSISVYYPAVALENEAVGNRLEEYAAGEIQNFKENFDEYFLDDPLLTGWYLEINFTHEPSPDSMICVLSWLWNYTGGAHGNSWTQAFPYDLRTGTFPGPVELLGGQSEFEAFVEEVVIQLDDMLLDQGWVEEGAAPSIENYHTVLPVPDDDGGVAGHLVIFPPYQVACYANGPVEVFVPAD